MISWRTSVVFALAALLAATAVGYGIGRRTTGSAHARAQSRRHITKTEFQPLALADLNGHNALVVTKVGDYKLHSPFMDFFGHLGPQAAFSPNVCDYLSAQITALEKVPTTAADGTKKATITANLHVTSLKQPVVLGYELRYTRMGLDVVSLGTGDAPTCLTAGVR